MANHKGASQYAPVVLLIIVLAWVIPAAGGMWVRRNLEKRLKASIGGTLVPSFLMPSFVLHDAKLEWPEKVRIEGGNLKVDYDPLFFIHPDLLKVRVSGNGLHARLLGGWAEVQGVENLDSVRLDAALGFNRSGLREVYSVEVLSPAFQFRIKKSEKE